MLHTSSATPMASFAEGALMPSSLSTVMKVSSTVLAEATPVDASAASPSAEVATAVPMMVVRRFIAESLRLSVTLAGTGRFRESPWRILGRTLECWLTDRQPDGGDGRSHLDRGAQHVAGDSAEPAHAVCDERNTAYERNDDRQRALPPPLIGEHGQRRDRDDPGQHHRGRLGARGASTQRAV